MRILKINWVIISLLAILIPAHAATMLTGIVQNEKHEPLPYANIFLKGRVEGTMSDEQGRFQLQVPAGKWVLIVTFIGFESFEKQIETQPNQQIELKIVLRQTALKGKTVMVSASAFTAADEEGVTLTSLDVVRTPGAAADLFWAIKSFPGLQQVDEGAGLFVRGGDVSETVISLDGAVINHPYRFESPTGGYFGTFSPFLLKGTFFSTGGFSAQFGNALSGALAMASHDLPERPAFGLGLGLAAESAYLSVPLVPEKIGFSFSGNRSNTQALFELNGCDRHFAPYPSAFDLNLNVAYKINAQHFFKLFLFGEDDRIGVEIDDPDYVQEFQGDNSNRFYHLKYQGMLGQNWLLQANLATSRYAQVMELGALELTLADQLNQARVFLEARLFQNWQWRSGLEFNQMQTEIDGRVPIDELDLRPDAPTEPVATRYQSTRGCGFSEIAWPTNWGFQMTAGVRAEHETISDEFVIDPRLSANLPLTSSSNISVAWGIFHQFPEPKYYDPFVGNPNLNSARAQHFILGYSFQKNNQIFRLEGYYKKYENLLLKTEPENYLNQGHGYARGIDAFAKSNLGIFSGWISYSWLQARRRWLDLPVLAPPHFDITHNFTAVLNCDLPGNFTLGSSLRLATGKPYTPASRQYHAARVPDFQKVDLSLSYLHQFFTRDMTIFYLAVSNVLNRINVFDYRYSDDYTRRTAEKSAFGRSVYFGVALNW